MKRKSEFNQQVFLGFFVVGNSIFSSLKLKKVVNHKVINRFENIFLLIKDGSKQIL